MAESCRGIGLCEKCIESQRGVWEGIPGLRSWRWPTAEALPSFCQHRQGTKARARNRPCEHPCCPLPSKTDFSAAKSSALCHTWARMPIIRKTRPFPIQAVTEMKTILSTLGAAFLLLSIVSDAQAAACAHGVRGAACAGPNGAAAVRKPYGSAAVVRRPPVAVAPRGAVVVPPRRGTVIVR